jgi:hypothetical protein
LVDDARYQAIRDTVHKDEPMIRNILYLCR